MRDDPSIFWRSFNPRSRVGSDATLQVSLRVTFGFNPRSRVGSDAERADARTSDRVSIRAPAWGATSI